MFNMKINKSDFEKVIECLRYFKNEGMFDFTPGGIALLCKDNTGVATVDLVLGEETFESCICTPDTYICIGLNIDCLWNMVKNNDSKSIEIQIDDAQTFLTIVSENNSQDKTMYSQIRLMANNEKHIEIENVKYDATVVMPSREFAKICEDLSSIGNKVVISVKEERVKFTTGGDIGASSITCKQKITTDDEEDAVRINLNKKVSLTFDLEYLKSFTKATPLSRTVTINLNSESPMGVEYNVAVAYKIGETGYIRFYLPQVNQACFKFSKALCFEEFVVEISAKCRQSFKKIKKELVKWKEVQSLFLDQIGKAASLFKQRSLVVNADIYEFEGMKDVIIGDKGNSLTFVTISINQSLNKFEEIITGMGKITSDHTKFMNRKDIKKQTAEYPFTYMPHPSTCLKYLEKIYNMHLAELETKQKILDTIVGYELKLPRCEDLEFLKIIATDEVNIMKDEMVEFVHEVLRGDPFVRD